MLVITFSSEVFPCRVKFTLTICEGRSILVSLKITFRPVGQIDQNLCIQLSPNSSTQKTDERRKKQSCRVAVIADDLNFCIKIPLAVHVAQSAADPFGWSFYVTQFT